jgi:uncharacterized membrane protein
MGDPRQTPNTTTLGRWRERRQAKRQQRFEREFFDAERTSGPDQDSIYRSSSAYTHSGPVGFWAGFGGDGGGFGGGCDGGGGGC